MWFGVGELFPPFELVPFGLFRLDPSAIILGPVLPIAQPGGVVSFEFTIDPVFRGVSLYTQAVIVHSGDPATWRLTNLLVDTFE